MVWKNELVVANLISVHCKQRSRDIWDHLQNYFLFIQIRKRSKFFCIVSFIWQLEGSGRCVSMKQKGGKGEHSIGIPLKLMLSALFVRFWQGFLLWKPFREDRSRWQGDPVCVIFGHSHWKSQIVVLFPPSPTRVCFSFFLPFPFPSWEHFYFFKAYIINHTASPKSWVCFWWTKLWLVHIFVCLKSDKAVGGLSPEAVQAELGERAGKPDCHFVGFSFTAAHFPGRPAAVISPGSKFRLKVFDKTTLGTPILSKPLWRRGPSADRLENWTSPWLFVVVFPCHWWDSLVSSSPKGFRSAIISAQIVIGRENFIASHIAGINIFPE